MFQEVLNTSLEPLVSMLMSRQQAHGFGLPRACTQQAFLMIERGQGTRPFITIEKRAHEALDFYASIFPLSV